MSKRDIGKKILTGIREVKAFKAGKKSLRIHSFREPSPRVVFVPPNWHQFSNEPKCSNYQERAMLLKGRANSVIGIDILKV